MDNKSFLALKKDIVVLLNDLQDADEKEWQFELSVIKDSLVPVLDNLYSYLEKLEGDLETMIQQLPECGKLLGQLSGLQGVLAEPTLYTSLMKCLIIIYKQTSKTQLSERARKWAMAQIRHMVVGPDKEYGLLERFGMNHSEVKSAELNQVVADILKGIARHYTQVKSPTDIDTGQSRCRTLDASVKPLVSMLLHMASPDQFYAVWEDVLNLLSLCSGEDKDVLELYQMFTETQKLGYKIGSSTRILLTKKACLLLWTNYLPSLEMEVLEMMDAATSCLMLPYCLKDLIKKRNLPGCCAVRLQLFQAVCHMLHTLLTESGGNGRVREVVSVFLQCVLEESMTFSIAQTLFQMYRMHSFNLQPLINLLSIDPKGLSCDTASHHIKQIIQCLHGDHVSIDNTSSLWLLQFQQWSNEAVLACLHCDKKLMEPCIDLMLWFNQTQKDENYIALKDYLNNAVGCLRSLMLKDSLKESDIRNATAFTNRPELESTFIVEIGKILIAFLFSSSAGMSIAGFLLKMITRSESPHQHLVTILTSQQKLEIELVKLSKPTLRNYIELLTNLRSKVKETEYSEENLSSDQYKSLINVVSSTLKNIHQLLSKNYAHDMYKTYIKAVT
ncbi:hypothetical protein ScPMuIL_005674 [Solemya velum]